MKETSKHQHLYTLQEILGTPLTREQALTSILQDPETARIFNNIPPKLQNQMLAFIQGAQGLKVSTAVGGQSYVRHRKLYHYGYHCYVVRRNHC